MAQNLELKARCRSLKVAEQIARSLGARDEGMLHQVDTYFDVLSGRLKLREIRGRRSELIFYDRPSTDDRSGRWSSYVVFPVREAASLRSTLKVTWPTRVTVRKTRRLYVLENARIHLDAVEELGSFIEFEVVLAKGRGQAAVLYRRLRDGFGISQSDLIGGSYADMLHPLRRT